MNKRFLLACCTLLFLSCKKNTSSENVQVVISMENYSGKSAVNRSYNITEARLYLSGFELVDNYGMATAVKDLILVNKNNSAEQNSFSFKMPSGNFTKLRYHFGLDRTTNNTVDPSSFDASHPLSLSQDMFWGMMRYRFIVVEGTIDSSAAKNQTPANPFSMHLGTDTIYRTITNDLTHLASGSTVNIRLDLNKLFILDENMFDITHFSNHSALSEIPDAIVITDNFVNGIQTTITNPL